MVLGRSHVASRGQQNAPRILAVSGVILGVSYFRVMKVKKLKVFLLALLMVRLPPPWRVILSGIFTVLAIVHSPSAPLSLCDENKTEHVDDKQPSLIYVCTLLLVIILCARDETPGSPLNGTRSLLLSFRGISQVPKLPLQTSGSWDCRCMLPRRPSIYS